MILQLRVYMTPFNMLLWPSFKQVIVYSYFIAEEYRPQHVGPFSLCQLSVIL